ncbi:MAG: hypothetical protein QOE77_3 [Blastocatellia bacterium]|nr:hypothetical protein [Blastocatellia bacterium]
MKKTFYILAVALCMTLMSGAALAQTEDDVVINEFSVNPTTGKEYIELLVTKPGGINMQGWTISDVSTRAGATAATEGDLTLPAAGSYLANVPQGTYVVIVLTTPAANANTLTEDTSLADGNGKLVLIAGTTTGLTAGGTLDNATADNVQVYAGTRAVGTLIDQVLVGNNTTSFIPGATWGDNNGATTTDNINAPSTSMPSNSIARFVPTANTVPGFQDDDTGARFVVDASSYGTPGATNTAVTDSAVTNPTYSAGNVVAGAYNGLNITGDVGIAGNVTVHGTLTINTGVITTGANTLTVDCGGSVAGASPTTYVNGNLKKNYCAIGLKGFEVGTANGYSPVSVNLTAGTFPTDFTVRAVQGPQPNIVTPSSALQRYWKLTATGVTANLIFNYLDIDVPAPPSTENTFVIFKWDGGFTTPGGSVNTATNEASISGVSDATLLSDWTLAQPNAPTAANGLVSGYILSNAGTPVEGAVVNLSGEQNRKTITNAKGYYQFDNVETNGFYTVAPSRTNYSFGPSSRSFSLLGNHTDAGFTGSSNGDNANPLDTAEYFVRQQYVDILGREPDEGGFNYWSNEILSCGGDTSCTDRRRREVAASFFIAEEFQDTGSFIYDMYKGSLGRKPVFNEYSADRKQVVGGATLTAQKAAFADSFVGRPEFVQKYQGETTAESFVDALLQNVQQASQLDLGGQRAGLISQYNAGGTLAQSRSLVLRSLADNAALKQKEYNAAFVLTEYFGYLRRNPEPEGYDFWLNVVTNGDVGNYRGMVCSFITSTEYQQRFSTAATHSNAECAQ